MLGFLSMGLAARPGIFVSNDGENFLRKFPEQCRTIPEKNRFWFIIITLDLGARPGCWLVANEGL